MEKIVSVLSDYAYKHAGETGFSYETYQYAFLILLETIAGIATGMGISIWLGIPAEAAIFIGIFFLLRSYAGGFHFGMFKKCYFVSMGILMGAFLIIKYGCITIQASAFLLFISIGMLILLKPAAIKNRPVDEHESIHFKKKLNQILFAAAIMYMCVVRMGYLTYGVTIALAVTVVNLLMLIGKWANK